MDEPTCPVCGARTALRYYGPFFTPDPVYRVAYTCISGDWRGTMRATIAEAVAVADLERQAATAVAAVTEEVR